MINTFLARNLVSVFLVSMYNNHNEKAFNAIKEIDGITEKRKMWVKKIQKLDELTRAITDSMNEMLISAYLNSKNKARSFKDY